MVACERQLAAEHRIDGPKSGVSSVIAGRWFLVGAHVNFVHDADDVFARVSGRIAHDHEQARLGALQTRLFLQFPHSSVNRVLALVNKPAGKRPCSFHRWVLSLNEQHALASTNGGVGRKGGVEPSVAFIAGGHLTHRSVALVPDRSVWLSAGLSLQTTARRRR